MKLFRLALVGTCMALYASAAFAGAIPLDPKIILGGKPDPLQPDFIVTTSFIIKSATGTSPGTSPCGLVQGGLTTTSPDCLFANGINPSGTGETITALTFDIANINPQTVTCNLLTNSPFSSCGVDPLPGGGTSVEFSGGSIPFQDQFTLDFQGFPRNTSFDGTATVTATPEPGTMALFLGGFGVFCLQRKLRPRHPRA